jgi:NAD-dependent SIR2 family protein deacetylase
MAMFDKGKIETAIRDADMVLIGIGEEFTPTIPDFEVDEKLRPYVLSQYYTDLPEDNETILAYKKLRTLIGTKPYFVITMNTDDLAVRGGFWKDLVVAPCGNMNRMQCSEHIVDAEPVREKILHEMNITHESISHFSTGTIQKHDAINCFGTDPNSEQRAGSHPEVDEILERYARCPECGAPLHFHIKSEEEYLEDGYLMQWKSYNNWLSCTLGHKLCILELGVGFQYPQVIRWPFEKITYFNQKATLIRVHSNLPQIAEEIGTRGISVASTPFEFLDAVCDSVSSL